MADKKYDWSELKKEFMLGDYKTVNEFLRAKNMAVSNTQKKYTKGWTQEKKIAGEKLVTKTIEKTIEKTAEANAKQLATVNSIAEVLLEKISKATNNLDIDEQKAFKDRLVEYNAIGKVKRETSIASKKNTVVELANALNIVANILSNGTESQENKIDKYFDQLNEVLDDGSE